MLAIPFIALVIALVLLFPENESSNQSYSSSINTEDKKPKSEPNNFDGERDDFPDFGD